MFQFCNHIALQATQDNLLSIVDQPAENEFMLELSDIYRDNRSGIALGAMVGSDLLKCEATRNGTYSMTMPVVTWIKDGKNLTSTIGFSSFLEITDFTESDAGVYQCVFTDTDAEAEVITTIPYRLDTGLTLMYCACTIHYIPPYSCILGIRSSLTNLFPSL